MSKDQPAPIREEQKSKEITRRQLLKMGAGAGAISVIAGPKTFCNPGRAVEDGSAIKGLFDAKAGGDKEGKGMQPAIDTNVEPRNPLEAATHPNPYPYYAKLVAERPLYWDPDMKLWVASGAEAVKSVMTSSICRVRPNGDPVPKHIKGSPAGDIFQQLVRQNDGQRHSDLREVTAAALSHISTAIDEPSRHRAGALNQSLNPKDGGQKLNDFIFGLSVYVIADLLNLPESIMPMMCVWVNQLSRCFSPLSTPEQTEEGNAAAARLIDIFKARESGHDKAQGIGGARQADKSAEAANQIGFFTQSYEATAALIGSTLLILASNDELHSQILARPQVLDGVLDEVLRYDSPVQNTRRFLSVNAAVAGKDMKEDESILVVFGAANRDPSLNPEPQSFQPLRQNRQMFTFGLGAHACMGADWAKVIAKAGIAQLLHAGINLKRISQSYAYRRSVNVRVPVFGVGESAYK